MTTLTFTIHNPYNYSSFDLLNIAACATGYKANKTEHPGDIILMHAPTREVTFPNTETPITATVEQKDEDVERLLKYLADLGDTNGFVPHLTEKVAEKNQLIVTLTKDNKPLDFPAYHEWN